MLEDTVLENVVAVVGAHRIGDGGKVGVVHWPVTVVEDAVVAQAPQEGKQRAVFAQVMMTFKEERGPMAGDRLDGALESLQFVSFHVALDEGDRWRTIGEETIVDSVDLYGDGFQAVVGAGGVSGERCPDIPHPTPQQMAGARSVGEPDVFNRQIAEPKTLFEIG